MAGSKKQLTMQQAIVVMIIGGVVLVATFFISTEPGTSAQMWKVLLGFVVFCILGVGAYLRPMKPKEEDK